MLHVPLRYHHFLGFKWESIFAWALYALLYEGETRKIRGREWENVSERCRVSQGAENKDSNVNRWTWHGWFTCVENLWCSLSCIRTAQSSGNSNDGEEKRSMSTSIRWIHVAQSEVAGINGSSKLLGWGAIASSCLQQLVVLFPRFWHSGSLYEWITIWIIFHCGGVRRCWLVPTLAAGRNTGRLCHTYGGGCTGES